MSQPDDSHVTTLLNRAGADDEAAIDELLPLVYEQLRCEAARRMAAERADHTLQPTALVHEAYLRLVGDRHIPWQNTAHFYAAAAESMGRILLDHANGTRDTFYAASGVLTRSIPGHPDYPYPYFSGFEDESGASDGLEFNRSIRFFQSYQVSFEAPDSCILFHEPPTIGLTTLQVPLFTYTAGVFGYASSLPPMSRCDRADS